MKRPAAVIKLEPGSSKKTKPGEAADALAPKPAEAPAPKPAKAPAPQPEQAPAPKPAEAEAAKPAKPAKASKSDKQTLPPPSKAAWNDLKYQCQTLAKKGKSHLQKAWQEAQAVKGLPERSHENEAWAEAGVKQYYFEKEVSHLEKLSHESLTKASQQVGGEALNDQDFERVEAHLQVTGPPQRMLLGSASSSAKGGSLKSLEKAYAEHLEKCKHLEEECNKALGKLESLTEAFKLENGKNPTAQLEASKTKLESLQESFSKKKEGYQQRILVYPEKAETPVNDADVKKLEELKKEMEAELKSLKKAMGPHKMWASNNKITVK